MPYIVCCVDYLSNLLMFHLPSLQDAMKSPEAKKKIQHVTWPWPLIPFHTDLMVLRQDRSLPSRQLLFPSTCALPFIVIPLIASKGWKTLLPPHSSRSVLRADRMGWRSEDRPAFEVTSFLVTFHNLKCPYRQWSATLLKSHTWRPSGGQNKQHMVCFLKCYLGKLWLLMFCLCAQAGFDKRASSTGLQGWMVSFLPGFCLEFRNWSFHDLSGQIDFETNAIDSIVWDCDCQNGGVVNTCCEYFF